MSNRIPCRQASEFSELDKMKLLILSRLLGGSIQFLEVKDKWGRTQWAFATNNGSTDILPFLDSNFFEFHSSLKKEYGLETSLVMEMDTGKWIGGCLHQNQNYSFLHSDQELALSGAVLKALGGEPDNFLDLFEEERKKWFNLTPPSEIIGFIQSFIQNNQLQDFRYKLDFWDFEGSSSDEGEHQYGYFVTFSLSADCNKKGFESLWRNKIITAQRRNNYLHYVHSQIPEDQRFSLERGKFGMGLKLHLRINLGMHSYTERLQQNLDAFRAMTEIVDHAVKNSLNFDGAKIHKNATTYTEVLNKIQHSCRYEEIKDKEDYFKKSFDSYDPDCVLCSVEYLPGFPGWEDFLQAILKESERQAA